MRYWEIIADNLSKAGWSWGCVSAIDSNGRTILVADTHRGEGKRFVVHAGEKLTAFLELESAGRFWHSSLPMFMIAACEKQISGSRSARFMRSGRIPTPGRVR
jgi:hypothetical protein